jgi:hypothetical protein
MLLMSKEVTPETSTKETAYNIIIDHVDVAEAEIDTKNTVTYLFPVDENFVKVSVPKRPATVARWKDCPRHPTPDLQAVDMLTFWCKNSAGDDHDRYTISHTCYKIVRTHSYIHLYTTYGSRWVEHNLPRFLWLHGKEIKDNLLGSMVIIPDVIDLLIRRFNQLDAANQKTPSLRWRHFFESSFSVCSKFLRLKYYIST